MNIILAGYNLDYEIIKEIRSSRPDEETLTPETISAAYARISRNPSPVTELRETARKEVEKARNSNRSIVFDMGHSSIAEHAVFNIDVLGVSRFLVEEIEKFRLCSYTEKSQRYILLEDDFVIPEEIRQTGVEEPFIKTIKEQNRFYHDLYSKLKPYIFEKNRDLASDPANHRVLEGWAKEDARYIISLATETQLGMTINARNLELMLRRCAAHPTAEAREYSNKLYQATKDVAPSLIRYTKPTEFDLMTRGDLKTKAKGLIEKWGGKAEKARTGATLDRNNVVISYSTPDADNRIVTSLIHSSSNISLEESMAIVSSMNNEEKEEVVKAACRYMNPHDAALREFENIDLLFELTISATCFAQLKRHRMATILCQDYDPALGVTIPPAISEIGMENHFRDVISRTEESYDQIKKVAPIAAGYILTNAHQKRVAIKINARELYHIARLRADRDAQWDIREIAEKMLMLGRKAMPLTLMLATGKDGFASLYDRCFTDVK
ncbi:MAG: FAD-dependent thymidylate synthase [Thermodesulfobacteriota bacterium]|nr:FAD-dependent thymidylate synthase [Thermodesulfobacteriota bacterium]